MPRGGDSELTGPELAELYALVESGYQEPEPKRATRRLAGRIARAVGLQVRQDEPLEESDLQEYDSPLDAVFAWKSAVFTIPLPWFRNHVLFGHGLGAFNAWEATARQLVRDPDLHFRDSILARFYERFRPATFAELAFADAERDVPRSSQLWQVRNHEYRWAYPWSPRLREWPDRIPEHLRLAEHGPVGDAIVQLEVWRLRQLLDSIGRDGYRPLEGSGIRGYFLKYGSSARFVVMAGFHRAVALAALGYDELPVLLSTKTMRLVSFDTVDHWPMVKNGLYSPSLAEAVVRTMVTDDGAELGRRLGFEPHSE